MTRRLVLSDGGPRDINDTIVSLLELFGSYDFEVKGEHSEMAARQLAAEQRNIYTEVLGVALAAATQAARQLGTSIDWPAKIDSFVLRALTDSNPIVRPSTDGFLISASGVPILGADATTRIRKIADSVGTADAAYFLDLVAAVVLRAIKSRLMQDAFRSVEQASVRLSLALARVETVASSREDETTDSVLHQKSSRAAHTELEQQAATLRAEIVELSAKVREQSDRLERLVENEASLVQRLSSAEKDIETKADEIKRDFDVIQADLTDQ